MPRRRATGSRALCGCASGRPARLRNRAAPSRRPFESPDRGAGRRARAAIATGRACSRVRRTTAAIFGACICQVGDGDRGRVESMRASTAASSASAARRRARSATPAAIAECTSAVASPSRSDSAAKSPPTSSACRSPSANRSRTLVRASAQPSEPVRRNSWSSPSVLVVPSMSVSIQPWSAAMCGLPARSARGLPRGRGSRPARRCGTAS